MEIRTYDVMNVECPNCGAEVDNDEVMNMCYDPCNGNVVECEECESELYMDVKIQVMTSK